MPAPVACGDQQKRERTSGKAAGARGRNRTGKKAGARSVSGVLRVSGSSKGE